MVLRFILITYYGKDYLSNGDENIYASLRWLTGGSFLLAIPSLFFFQLDFFLIQKKTLVKPF